MERSPFSGDSDKTQYSYSRSSKCYRHFLAKPELTSGCNAGFENLEILDIAQLVRQKTGAEIIISDSNDPRSYRQDSSKLLATGFQPKFSVQTAIDEITHAYRSNNLPDGKITQ